MEPFQKTNQSAYLNFLHAKYEMYSGEVVAKSHPYYLGIDPSDLCQLRCPTCPTGIENESRRSKAEEKTIFRDKRSMMNPELLDAILDELGEYLFLVMFYNYGEPLLNKHLSSFIRKAKAFQIETEVHTNLSLQLTDQQIDELLSSGIDRLDASIDGFSQSVYQIHRVGGDVELAKKNLERLARARDRLGLKTEIGYNFIVFSFNEHEVEAAREYSKSIGVHFHDRNAFTDNPDWLPSFRKGEKAWRVPKQARIKEDRPFAWSPLPQVDAKNAASACGWHYGYSMVTGGGPVAPCCAVSKDQYDFGTIIPGQVKFGDVWNNDLFRKSRADFAGKTIEGLEQVQTICTTCPYPKGLHHLYSVYDIKVLSKYVTAFRGSDPAMDEAFDLFSSIRYGLSIDDLLAYGTFPPMDQLIVGFENAENAAKFANCFEKNFGSGINGAIQAKTVTPAAG